MDHQYIEDQRVADRYLDRTLPAAERTAFEKHFVDCTECLDRLALAEIFRDTPPRYRDTAVASGPAGPPPPVPVADPVIRPAPTSKFRQANTQTIEMVAIFATAALLFVSVPAAYFIWQYTNERRADQGPSASLYALVPRREQTIQLGALPHPVVFSVDISNDPTVVSRRVSLVASGKVVWDGGALVPPQGPAPGIVIPSRVLPAGLSTLRIEGRQAGGNWRVVAEFTLRVVRVK